MNHAAKVRLRWEIGIVLALSLGASAVSSIVRIIERLTRETPLGSQSTTIHSPASVRPVFDLIFQLVGITFALAPVALVIFLLWEHRKPHLQALGLGRPLSAQRRWWWVSESGWGFALAAIIGIPGLGLYMASRAMDLSVAVITTNLNDYWWTIPVLVLSACRAALLEELIVVAYLFNRLKKLGVGPVAIIVSSALLRGSYHLYQGIGGFVGNAIMGLVFGWAYHRWGRSLPLIVAHVVLDIVSFVGYPLAVAWLPELFGPVPN